LGLLLPARRLPHVLHPGQDPGSRGRRPVPLRGPRRGPRGHPPLRHPPGAPGRQRPDLGAVPALMAALLALALLAAPRASAATFSSPTFDLLQDQAAKDPAGAGSPEAAKQEGGKGFTGEAGKPAATGPAAQAQGDGMDHYHFTGTQPLKGVSIYTPVKDA